ncbi:hypothetical protein COCNU_scaffold045056G000070 [Cocos nucifera]|nr:hypothetical protein [Cocos nucifera]
MLLLLFIMSIYFARRKPVRRVVGEFSCSIIIIGILTEDKVGMAFMYLNFVLWEDNADEEDFRSGEPLLLNLDTLRAATNNFSDANKLGEDGFGPVYKGILRDEQRVSVKRLSISSGQGLEELRNKVVLFAKLQHRNLEDPEERPDMASIVLMLTSYSVSLPAPSTPAFFVRGGTTSESEVNNRNMGTGFSGSEDSNGRTARLMPNSINGVSITEMEPR